METGSMKGNSIGVAETGNLDERDAVWQKLQLLKEEYLQDMTELYHILASRSQQPMPPEHLQKLNHYKEVLQRMIPYLKVPKEKVPPEFNQDKVEAFEKSIVNIIETFKLRRQKLAQATAADSGLPSRFATTANSTTTSSTAAVRATPAAILDTQMLHELLSRAAI